MFINVRTKTCRCTQKTFFFFFFFGQGFSDCEIFSNIGITGIKQSYLCIYIYMTSLNVQIDLFKYTKRFIKSASVL